MNIRHIIRGILEFVLWFLSNHKDWGKKEKIKNEKENNENQYPKGDE